MKEARLVRGGRRGSVGPDFSTGIRWDYEEEKIINHMNDVAMCQLSTLPESRIYSLPRRTGSGVHIEMWWWGGVKGEEATGAV